MLIHSKYLVIGHFKSSDFTENLVSLRNHKTIEFAEELQLEKRQQNECLKILPFYDVKRKIYIVGFERFVESTRCRSIASCFVAILCAQMQNNTKAVLHGLTPRDC